MFELIATLCFTQLCAERVLPAPAPMSQAACEASMQTRAQNWVKTHEGYTLRNTRCESLLDLEERASSVSEISPGQFVHRGKVAEMLPENAGDIANTGFIIGDKQVAVIDAGASRQVAEALYLAVRLKTDLPIRFNLLTHMHPYHTLGAEVFKEAGATVIGSAKLAEALGTRNDIYSTNLRRILGEEAFHGTQALLPDRAIADTETLELGNRPLQLRSWPTAHTTNDMTILDVNSSTIWMGDLVFLEHTPALDGSITGWVALLENLDDSAAEFLVPGHGPVSASYPEGAQPTLAYLEAVTAETRQAIAKGESLSTAVKHVGHGLQGEWVLFDSFNPRNATNAYTELEWE